MNSSWGKQLEYGVVGSSSWNAAWRHLLVNKVVWAVNAAGTCCIDDLPLAPDATPRMAHHMERNITSLRHPAKANKAPDAVAWIHALAASLNGRFSL